MVESQLIGSAKVGESLLNTGFHRNFAGTNPHAAAKGAMRC